MANNVSIDLELAIKDFQQNLNKAHQQVDSFHNDFKANTKGSSQAWNSFVGNLAANAVSTATNALGNLVGSIGDLGRSAIKNAGELEMMSVELGVMLGSAAAGEAQLKSLQQFAATSPFQLPGIVEANKLLLGFGSTAKEVPGILEVLGNVAAGSGKPLADLARIFGQVQAETKLSLERLNQLNDAGINLGPTLANKLGLPLKDVRKAVTDGKVSFDLFRESMIQIQAEGGVYAGGMIKQSQTLQGVLSSLSDNFFNLSGDIGKSFLPMVKTAALALIAFTDTIVSNIENIKIAVQTVGILAGAYGAYLIATNLATIATTGLATAIAVLTSPVTLIIAGVVALGAAVFSLIKYWDEVKLAFLTGTQVILQTIQPLQEVFNKLFGIDVTGVTVALDSIGKSIGEVKANIAKKNDPIISPAELEAAKKAAEELSQKTKETNAAMLLNKRTFNAEMLAISQEGLNSIAALEAAAQDERRNAEIANSTMSLQEKQAAYDLVLTNRIAQQAEELLALQDVENQKLQISIDAELAKAQLITDSDDKRKAIQEANQKAEIARLSLYNKQQVDTISLGLKSQKAIDEKSAKDKESTLQLKTRMEESYLNSFSGFIGAAATLAKAGSREAKTLAIVDATVATYLGATKAMASVPYPANFIAAGSVIAGGLANVAKITNAGSFAQGGIVPGNSYAGDRLQANVNSSEMILNKSQQSELFNLANGSSGGGNNSALIEEVRALRSDIKNLQVVVYANDNEIARSASRGAQNGIEIGRTR